MLIGHLTDLHIVEEGQKLGGILDVNALASMAVDTINASPVPPAFIVVTGDLTHGGSLAEMTLARDILDRLTMPYYAMPGGHDTTSAFDEVFGDRGWRDQDSGDVRYVVNDFAVRLVVADTTGGKGVKPSFGTERSSWLGKALGAAPDEPTLLAIHHPPFQCRIPVAAYVEDPQMQWASELKRVVGQHPQIKTVCCGHVHRTTHGLWAGTMVSIGPGVSVQAEPVFGNMDAQMPQGRRAGLVTEPGGWQALWWDGESLINFGLLTDPSYARY